MNYLRQFSKIAAPFWLNRASWPSWLMLGLCITAKLAVVEILVRLNTWNKLFIDALAAIDVNTIYDLLFEFIGLVAIIVALKVYSTWLKKWVELRWRTWLTERLLSSWMQGKTYYRLTLNDEPDNPDQRIAEDARLLTTDTITLLLGLIQSVATLAAFSVVLWQLSGDFVLPFGDMQLSGYLLWLAIIYAILGSGVTHAIGRKLHQLYYGQQQREADFRANLVRKREHAEQIALLSGETFESEALKQNFSSIASNWRALMNREKKLNFVVEGYHQIAKMLPYFAAIPALIAQTITIGGVFQVRMAFMKVYASLSWFIHRYDDLARWSATVERINQFDAAMQALNPTPEEKSSQTLGCQSLSLSTPQGRPLLSDLTWSLESSLLLSGASGLGKTTLLRTLAGIWPYYQGSLSIPEASYQLLPQRPYLPAGSLRHCLSYPQTCRWQDEEMQQALLQVGLTHLSTQLDHVQEWARKLSAGEQQRFAIARALLHKPKVLVLDEATSNLDNDSATKLITALKQALPTSRLLMISHQQHLRPLFDDHLNLNAYAAPQP